MSRHTQFFGIAEQSVHLLRVDGPVNIGIVCESTPGSVFTNTHLQKISFKKNVRSFVGTSTLRYLPYLFAIVPALIWRYGKHR
jgi:hypothetical protein